MSPPPLKNITFFGATGGCTFSTLRRSLLAGHKCRVLARNPTKLLDMLRAYNIDVSSCSSRLQIVQGNVTDIAAVTKALVFEDGVQAGVVVCGIGGVQPRLQFSLSYPLTIEDPHICHKGTTAILSALSTLRSKQAQTQTQQIQAPLFIIISSAGVATTYRDWPLLMLPFYRWLLNTMLDDKRAVHDAVLAAASPVSAGGKEQVPLIRFVSVRPSHLVDGVGLGREKIRASAKVVDGKAEVMGYQIAREDVGMWIFEELVGKEVEVGLLNGCVIVTW